MISLCRFSSKEFEETQAPSQGVSRSSNNPQTAPLPVEWNLHAERWGTASLLESLSNPLEHDYLPFDCQTKVRNLFDDKRGSMETSWKTYRGIKLQTAQSLPISSDSFRFIKFDEKSILMVSERCLGKGACHEFIQGVLFKKNENGGIVYWKVVISHPIGGDKNSALSEKYLENCRKVANLSCVVPWFCSFHSYNILGSEIRHIVFLQCNQGDALSYIKRLDPSLPESEKTQQVVLSFMRMAGQLHNLHCAGFLHRDIKPTNFLCHKQGEYVFVWLGDLETICSIKDKNQESLGTFSYQAIERVKELDFSHDLKNRVSLPWDTRHEVWSLGMSFFALLRVAQNPKSNENSLPLWLVKSCDRILHCPSFVVLKKEIQKLQEASEPVGNISNLIIRMLHEDPSKRPSTFEVRHALAGISVQKPLLQEGLSLELCAQPDPQELSRNSSDSLDSNDCFNEAGINETSI